MVSTGAEILERANLADRIGNAKLVENSFKGKASPNAESTTCKECLGSHEGLSAGKSRLPPACVAFASTDTASRDPQCSFYARCPEPARKARRVHLSFASPAARSGFILRGGLAACDFANQPASSARVSTSRVLPTPIAGAFPGTPRRNKRFAASRRRSLLTVAALFRRSRTQGTSGK